MKYAILVYETPEEFAERDDETLKGAYWGAYTAYGQSLGQGGVAAGGAGLLPPATATTLRLRGGSRQVVDGPYAETKEQLGGFFLIEAPDLDAALDWAAKCPAATRGAIEVRPVMGM
ncbi:MAG: YciI family protein [Hyphomonadaceae bacterium]|nr:YciI family protein [Hyphomonadaceae bacterium]